MSGETRTFFVITCDGCGTTLGENGEHHSAVEARAAARTTGWTFPLKVRANGRPAARRSDVCPKCSEDWDPKLWFKENRKECICGEPFLSEQALIGHIRMKAVWGSRQVHAPVEGPE